MAKRIPESELIINPDGSIYHLNLKPEHLASNIIAVGDPDRVAKISRYFDEIEFKISKREFVTHTGWYRGTRITAISTGMGTDNIEIFMTELDALVNIDLKERVVTDKHKSLNIVRVGTSGSMRREIPEGSLLASEYGIGLDTLMAFYKTDYTEFEENVADKIQDSLELGFRPYCIRGSEKLMKTVGKGLIIGNTVTCPGFFGPQGREVRVKPALPDLIEKLGKLEIGGIRLTNFEMETAGYYAMGRLLGHEVLSLNAIIANRISKKFSKDPYGLVDQLIRHTLNEMAGI
ncbi:Purine nucleoside phosphorylase [Mariniradius saccharolyticus AK6]|uniref:Purine nucleoside phosphorylase n=1 Tax=Mariniradius saccharolyticus AK6 TaxID=1239962 RepID=M7Y3M6_9BACT|nr:nucleoside phosphorylase [Mariniradius saccharolyticus]EMS31831.1 Purine nucleoside phosphorylase [Mariniradius saccharolyticus AK6]